MSTDWFVDQNLIHTGRTAIAKRPDGTPLIVGDVWNDITECVTKKWTGSQWTGGQGGRQLIAQNTTTQTINSGASAAVVFNNYPALDGISWNPSLNQPIVLTAGRYQVFYSFNVRNTGGVNTEVDAIMGGLIEGSSITYRDYITLPPNYIGSISLIGVFDWPVGPATLGIVGTSAANIQVSNADLYIKEVQ